MTGVTTTWFDVATTWSEVTLNGSSISGRTFRIGLQSETDAVQIAFGTSAPTDAQAGETLNFLNNKEQTVDASAKLYIKSVTGRAMPDLPIHLSSAA